MHRQRIAVRFAAAFAFAVLIPASPTQAAAPQFTPVAASVAAPIRPVTATDGRRHLVYELRVQNVSGVPVQLRSLAVRTNRGRTLLSLAGSQIATVLTADSAGPTDTLPAHEAGTVWLDVAPARAVRALVHRIGVRAILPPPDPPVDFTFGTARVRVVRRAAIAVAPPLRGQRLVNANGCCGLSPHRTGVNVIDGAPFLSQRFAIDFLRIDKQGRAFTGDITRNDSFLTFRNPVYAAAAGRVVTTRNNLPENTPPEEPAPETFTPATALGNNVVEDLGGRRFALYAHLDTGSVRVHRGQRVRAGQMLGRVGNTGASGAPHLHFHISDGPGPLASDGLPYVFSHFALTGRVTNLDEFLTGTANAVVSGPTSRRSRQLPLQATVLDFRRP